MYANFLGASPWDRWRINGPARMKGTEEEGVENPFSFSRVYPPFAPKDVSHSFSLSLLLGQFQVLRSFFSFSHPSFSHLSIFLERLRSSQIREPPNKRADRVYSRGSERLWAPRKREEIGIPALYSCSSSLPSLSSTVLNGERLGAEDRRIPRNDATTVSLALPVSRRRE